MRLTEVIHALRTKWNAHMSGVVSIVGLVAVSSYSFAMRSNVIVVVSPSPIFADKHTNPFSELTEPGNSSDVGTDGHTRTVSRLIAILMVRTFSDAQISDIFSEESGDCRTGNHAHGSIF
jgi:hypothetical protein